MITYGVELEFCSSVHIRDFVAQLQKRNVSIEYVDPKLPTAPHWKAERDYSVMCNGKNRFGSSLKTLNGSRYPTEKLHSIEVVSPILTTIMQLTTFLKKMHSLNATYLSNQTHGFHVHISNKYLQYPTFINNQLGNKWVFAFCINWTAFEPLILSRHHSSRHVSPHARSLQSNIEFASLQSLVDSLEVNTSYPFHMIMNIFNPPREDYGSRKVYPKGQYHRMNLSHGRNSVVNLANLRNKAHRKGTIEIRSHQGTTNAHEIVTFVKFIKSFFASCYKNNKFIDARALIFKKHKKHYTLCSLTELEPLLEQFLRKR